MQAGRLLPCALVILGATAACGLSVTGTGTPETSGQGERSTVTDGGTGPGQVVATSTDDTTPAACADDGGCSAPDASTAPPLGCTSSASCGPDVQCCFDGATGSQCRRSCAPTQVVLCHLGGANTCGEHQDCFGPSPASIAGGGVCMNTENEH
jgi:hypothetical protein